MLIFSSNYLAHRTRSALHVMYYKDKKNAFLKTGIASIKSDTYHVYRLGEHFSSYQHFQSYPTIVLHPISDQYWEETLQYIVHHEYDQWFQQYALTKYKELIVIGNSVRMMSKKPIIISHENKFKAVSYMKFQDGIKVPSKISHRGSLRYEKGLDLFPYSLDINFEEKTTFKNDPIYAEEIEHISQQKPIYLLDPGVVITSRDLKSFMSFIGSWYKYENRHLSKLTQMNDVVTQKKLSVITGRELEPMKAVYDTDLSIEKKRLVESLVSNKVNTRID